MKKLIRIIPLVIAVLVYVNAKAQDEGDISEMYLKGKWIASCPMEVVNRVTIGQCPLCTFVVNANDKSLMNSSDVEMTFNEDSIVLSRNGKMITVPYRRDKNNHSIAFKIDTAQYNFKVFFYDKKRILVNTDRTVAVIERAK